MNGRLQTCNLYVLLKYVFSIRTEYYILYAE
jgi:hypothetical protein